MRLIRHAGTWVPLLLALMFAVAWWNARDHELTWERPLAYGIGALSLAFGTYALVQIARRPHKEHAAALLLFFIYQKVSLALVFGLIFFLSVNLLYPGLLPGLADSEWSEDLTYALLVSSILAAAVVNMLLFFGRKRGWLDVPVDPVPGRSVITSIRRRRRDQKRNWRTEQDERADRLDERGRRQSERGAAQDARGAAQDRRDERDGRKDEDG
jgi:hypothetical protein